MSFLGIPGVPTPAYAPKETGFRSMATFTDKWGKPAVYAASDASLIPGRLLLKSTDGTSWQEVATAPSILESDSRSMAVHGGKLDVAPAGSSNTATIWATDDPLTSGDGSNWKKVGDFVAQKPAGGIPVPRLSKSGWPGGFGNILNLYCWSLMPSHGVLYLGTFDVSWFLSLLLPGIGLADAALSDNDVGLKETVSALEKLGLDKYYAPYRQFVVAPVASDLAAPDSDLAQDSPLNYFFGGDLWKTRDGLHWEPVTLNGFGNPRNYGLRPLSGCCRTPPGLLRRR